MQYANGNGDLVALGSPLGREVAPRQVGSLLAGWLARVAGSVGASRVCAMLASRERGAGGAAKNVTANAAQERPAAMKLSPITHIEHK